MTNIYSARRFFNAKFNLFHKSMRSKTDVTFGIPVLEGSCDCGKVGYSARGASSGNFYSHSTAPRAASGDPYLTASAFKPNQVMWRGNDIIDSKVNRSYMPPKSENAHYFCPCEKKQVLNSMCNM